MADPGRERKEPRARRSRLHTVLSALGLAVVFAAALIASIPLHFGLARSKRIVVSALSSLLDRTFTGRIHIENIERLDLYGVGGVSASVYDEAGELVLSVHGLRARSPLAALAWEIAGPRFGRAALGKRKLRVAIARVRIEHAEVNLIPDARGVPTLARALTPRKAAGAPAEGSGPDIEVWLPAVAVAAAEVRGRMEFLGIHAVDLANVKGSVLAGNERVSIHVERYSLGAEGDLFPARLLGTAQTIIEMPSSTGHPLSLWGTFDGFLGDVELDLRLGLDGDVLDLLVDVPHARKDAVHAILPSFPVLDDVSAHIEARGALPVLGVNGTGKIGASEIAIAGQCTIDQGVRLQLDVDVHGLDLRSFALSAPGTGLAGRAKLDLAVPAAGPVQGSAEVELEAFQIDPIEVPALTASVKFDPSGAYGSAVLGSASFSSRVSFQVLRSSIGAPVAVDWEWSGQTPDTGRVAWLAAAGSGQASWRAKGHIADGRLDAQVDGEVASFSRSGMSLERAHVAGSVRGPFEGLVLASTLEGRGLRAGGLYFSEVEGELKGPFHRLSLTASARESTEVALTIKSVIEGQGSRTRLSGVELTAERGEVTLVARVAAVEVGDSGVVFQGLEIDGAGTPVRGTLAMGPSEWRIELASAEVDLAKLAAIAGPAVRARGLLAFDLEAAFGGRADHAHARMQLRDGELAGVSGIGATGEALLDARQLSGGVHLEAAGLGSFTATFPAAKLAGPPLQKASWLDATGNLQVNAQVDLKELATLPIAAASPIHDATGVVRARGIFAREDLDVHRGHSPSAVVAPPADVDLLLWTDGFRMPLGSGAAAKGPFKVIEGVDGQLGLHLEGESGRSNLTARVIDQEGVFAALSVLADLPVGQLWDHPERIRTVIERLPLTAHLSLPRRNLASYPALLRNEELIGEVEATADLTGSLRAPALSANVRGYALQSSSAGIAIPIDVQLQASYDGVEAIARAQAIHQQKVVLDGTVRIQVPVAALLDGGGHLASGAWEGSGSARLTSFPLASFPALAERQVAGLASGTLEFSGIGRDPEVQALLALSDVHVDRAAFPRGAVSGRIAHGGALVSASLDQVQGGASASVLARVRWSSSWFPTVDDEAPVDFFAEARDVRAALLYPFLLRGVFAYFDGRLNGSLHLHQERQGGKDVQTADGSFDLRDASFQIPEIGQELHGARASIVIQRGGEVLVNDVAASATSGRLTATGKLLLDGFRFARGEATVRVNRNAAIPLTLEGVSIGEAWGTLGLRASMAGERTVNLDVDVPVFHTEIPESSSRDLQSLAANPKIDTGLRAPDGTLDPLLLAPAQEKRAEDALSWHLTVHLGQDVYLRRGSSIELFIRGTPVVDITDAAHVSGQVEFVGGKVEVFGKRFELENGTARFDRDEPGNPYVSVTARWDAPDGTRIYANFVGPLRTGVLTLRAEPTRSQNEVMSILLLGSGDSSDAAQTSAMHQAGTQTAGAVLAGGAVTTSLNRVLSSVSPLDITTRVTTTAEGATQPEVAVQIARGVTAQVSYRARPTNPAENPDRVLVTLDWRFRRNWSVVTTFGMATSVLDLIWQYRY